MALLGRRDVVKFGLGYVGLVSRIFKSVADNTWLAQVTILQRPEHGAYGVGSSYLFEVSELTRLGNLDAEPELAYHLVQQ